MKVKTLIQMVGLAFAQPLMMAEASGAGDVKKPQFCKKEYDLDTGVVEFAFGNGKVVTIDSNALSTEIKNQLMLHGIAQKVGDSYAGVKGDFAAGISNAEEVVAQLMAGAWKGDREGDAKPRLAELAEAIARIKQVPLEAATKAVEAGTDEQRKSWRSNAKVKSVIAQIRAEKAAAALEAAGEQTLDIAV